MNSTSPPPFPIKSSEKSEIFFGKVKNWLKILEHFKTKKLGETTTLCFWS
jgi:hypothetical protein